jgi:hypothetical protein
MVMPELAEIVSQSESLRFASGKTEMTRRR